MPGHHDLRLGAGAEGQPGARRAMDNLGKAVAAQLLRMEIEASADLPRLKTK